MHITLCMMLKNEADTIKDTLGSVVGIIDRAVIGIDDKSSDQTYKIVENVLNHHKIKYTIGYFTFENNFSNIRNKLIKECEDWVLVIDGHELLTTQSQLFLRKFKDGDIDVEKGPEIFDFNVIEPWSEGETIFQQPRLFKNNIRYTEAAHNVIMQTERRMVMPQVVLIHKQSIDRLKARRKQRRVMNIKVLKGKAKKGDVRSMFYLGNTYYEMKNYEEAERWYKTYIPKSDFLAEKYTAHIYLALMYQVQKKWDNMREILMESMKCEAGVNDHLLLLGDYYSQQEQFDIALVYYRMASSFKTPRRFLITEATNYTYKPWLKIAITCLSLDDAEGVIEACQKGKMIAPEKEEFGFIERRVKEKLRGGMETQKKGAIYFVGSYPIFLEPIIESLKNEYDIRYEQKFDEHNANFAHLIWCDFADYNAIAVSNYKRKVPKIVRIHAYEAFQPMFMNSVHWDNFDKVIFVADHIRKHVERYIDPEKCLIISNGVDLEKYQIVPNKPKNNNIAYAGYIANKKGAIALLLAAERLNKYQFHVVGDFQEEDVAMLFENNKPTNMELCPWQKDLNAFFADKSYIINTSPRESQCMSVMEGMACGLKPLIYNWPGAKDIYKSEGWIWKSFEELSMLVHSDLQPQTYRSFIINNYNVKDKLSEIHSLVDRLIKENKNEREQNIIGVQGHSKYAIP